MNMAFKHMSLLWSAKGVIMDNVGDTAFLPEQTTYITRSLRWYGFFPGKKKITTFEALNGLAFDSAYDI